MNIPKLKLTEQKRTGDMLRHAEDICAQYIDNITKLHSLKTALMQDLLTGKVPVTLLLKKMGAEG